MQQGPEEQDVCGLAVTEPSAMTGLSAGTAPLGSHLGKHSLTQQPFLDPASPGLTPAPQHCAPQKESKEVEVCAHSGTANGELPPA